MKVKLINKAVSKKSAQRIKRKLRIRAKISGNASRPRVCFFRSNKNIEVQAIDDRNNVTLVSISTYEEQFKKYKPSIEVSATLGKTFAARLKEKNIAEVVMDRNGYKYHGILESFTTSLRDEGIQV